MTEHEIIGLSDYYRTHVCHGSVFMKQKFPPKKETPAMAWGTGYHKGVYNVFTDYLYRGFSLEEAHKIHGKDYFDEEMEHIVWQTCLEMKAQLEAVGPKKIKKIALEEKLMLSEEYHIGGTIDFCYLVELPNERVFVSWDHKGGEKVVEAEGNLQLIAGACAAYNSEKWGPFDRAVLHIYQPKVEHPEGPLRRMKILKEDLEQWTKDILEVGKKVALELEREAPTFNVGPHCQWCVADGNCQAQLGHAQAAASMEFLPVEIDNEPELPDVHVLTYEQKEALVLYRKQLESFLAAVTAVVLDEMDNQGVEYPRLKLVKSRTRRAWAGDAEELVKVLEAAGMEKPYKIEPCTLTAVTKALGKKKAEEIFAEWTDKPEGSLQLAALDDNRVAVEPKTQKVLEEFKDGI